MKAYFLAYKQYLLCESETQDDVCRLVIGAFVPAIEGNYYQEVIIGFNEANFIEWRDWLIKSIETGLVVIDDEFSFEPSEVRIVSAEVNI